MFRIFDNFMANTVLHKVRKLSDSVNMISTCMETK